MGKKALCRAAFYALKSRFRFLALRFIRVLVRVREFRQNDLSEGSTVYTHSTTVANIQSTTVANIQTAYRID